MGRYPDWVEKHRRKGTQIVKIGKNYYLYQVRSDWDPIKKRARKITERYLGKITPEGLIKPKHERVLERLKKASVREYGASKYIYEMNRDILESLVRHFPEYGKEIFVFSMFRMLYNSPIKNIHTYYTSSFISEILPNARLSTRFISKMLKDIGIEREKIRDFLKDFIVGDEFAVIDITHIFSLSENVISSTLGYNSKREFLPQIHVVFLYSLDRHMPSYFRIIPGSISDVSALITTVREACVNDVVLIGDKGFFSTENVCNLDKEGIHYILPLRRNLSIIDYSRMKSGDKRTFDGYFLFEKRVIWYYEYKVRSGDLAGKRIIVYLDERLKTEEERDYILRLEDEEREIEELFENQHKFGTIAVLTDLKAEAERIYNLLKSRVEIEVMFDAFKNILHADRSYMRSDEQIEAWIFINFIALIFYYRIYRELVEHGLLKKYSPKDILIHLQRIHKIKIDNRWFNAEIPKKTKIIIDKLNIKKHIT